MLLRCDCLLSLSYGKSLLAAWSSSGGSRVGTVVLTVSLGFRNDAMLGNGDQHCGAHYPWDSFWEGRSCRAAPEMFLDPADLLFALEQVSCPGERGSVP